FLMPISINFTYYYSEVLVTLSFYDQRINIITIQIVPSALCIFVFMVIYGLLFALTFPSMNKIIAESSEMHERGKANGIFYSYFSLGSVAGSTLAGYFTTAFGLPFFGIGFVTLLMLGLMLFVRAKWV